MPDNDAPVRDTLAVMTAASLENSNLPPRELMIVRLGALAAVDAPATSYALNVEAATEAGLTLDDVQDVLVAVAPIIGTSRVVSAAANIAEGLGLVIALAEAELEAELDAEEDGA
jgi:alkylhydroperoxidase/carboxymuconolactone decarboxylase family protein YurZ